MNTYYNKEIKRYRFWFLIISLVIIAIGGFFLNYELTRYKQEQNRAIGNLVSSVMDTYPEADVEDIIKSLNSRNQSRDGIDKLIEYGINSDEYTIDSMEEFERKVIVVFIGLVAATIVTFLVFASLYLRRRSKNLNILSAYINRLSRGDYTLDFRDNSEDELSNVKNELYKISVMLKEQADIAVGNKEALAESVSDISHQLKTPLSSISILLDNLISSKCMPDDKRQQFLMEIERQTFIVNWMVQIMLKLSRLDAGVVNFECEDISVRSLLEEIKENLEIIAEVKGVEICINMQEDVSIKGDYIWNKEAISNIVKNGIEHSYENKKLVIVVKDNDVYTKIAITNYGKTISETDKKHLFERFYKAEGADKDSNGIGLSLSKSIINKQNGYISLESENEITTFTIKYRKN